jgi:ubiquinone/menaquinone biosynthesis C-methylase UbiE
MAENKKETDTGPAWQVVEKAKKATFRPHTFTNHTGQSLVGVLRFLPRNSPVWSKFGKFLRKVHMDCDVKKFQSLVREARNDVEFLKTLKKRMKYPGKKKEEKKEEATAHGSAAQEQKKEQLPQAGTDAAYHHKKETGRARSRIADIEEFIKPFQGKFINYLDLGCSEGKITSEVSTYLSVDSADESTATLEEGEPEAFTAYGVDVVSPLDSTNGFIFRQYDGVNLPFPDEYFALATVFMSAHHFTDPKATLEDLHRVMAPSGVVVVREHDVRDFTVQVFLDFVHAIYMSVVGREMTPERFAEVYSKGQFATYRPISAWKDVFASVGFVVKKHKPTRDMFESCYMMLEKE